jgi:hypothetical protein
MENKSKFVEAKTLNSEEWHLTLEMSTSETAHAGRERENTLAKQYQDKVWVTKAQ